MLTRIAVLCWLLLCLAVSGRVPLAADLPRPSNELLRAMTDAAEIGTDKAFEQLKDERGFRPETVVPKGLRSLMEEPKFPLRGLHAAWTHKDRAAALSWWSELESDQEVADLAPLVRERLERAGYTEGEAPTDTFFRSQFDRLRLSAKELLTFRREADPCRELIAVVLIDRNAQPDSKVRLGIQWYVIGPIGDESLTLKTLSEDLPMLASSALDPRVLEEITSVPIAEFETSLQIPSKDPAAPRRSILGRRNWAFETPQDLQAVLKAPLTAAGYAVAETHQLGGGGEIRSWKRGATEYINVLSGTAPRARTRLTVVNVVPAQTAPPQSASARSRPPGASATSQPLAELMPILLREAEVGTDPEFDTFKEGAGLVSETAAPKALREFLSRSGYGFKRLSLGVAAAPEGLRLIWFAEASLGSEVASTSEQIQDEVQERLEKLGFQKVDQKALAVLPETELNFARSRAKVLRPYQKIAGTTSELAVVAVSEPRVSNESSKGLAVIWVAEAGHPAKPFTLADIFETLPFLRPAELDQSLIDAFSAAPLDEWERILEDPVQRRRRRSPGILLSLRVGWKVQVHADLRTRVKDALIGGGFQTVPGNDAKGERFTVESWRRDGDSVTVQFIAPPPNAADQRPVMGVSGMSLSQPPPR